MGSYTTLRVNRALTIDLLKRLIRIPSVNPAIDDGRGEQDIAAFIAEWFRKTMKFHILEQKVGKDRFNVVAILEGKGNGRSLMLNGHMDTVGISDMTVNPFNPFIEKGNVHGRGSCDMKGSIAAMMSSMLALAKSKERLAGDVIFTGVVDEENFSIGMFELIKRFRADAAIVGEPTGMDIAVAHKGQAWLEIETIGRRAHGSVPERGIDAIEKMAKIISQFDSVRGQHALKTHRLLGTPKLHTSTIKGGTDWSTVPAKCVLRLERRVLPGERPHDAVREMKEVVANCSRRDPSLKAKVRLIYYSDPFEGGKAFHVSLLREHVRRLGGRGKIIGVPYWTDAAILENRAQIPTCLFGPGDIRVAHSPDEFVRINDVVTAARIYAESAQTYCSNVPALPRSSPH